MPIENYELKPLSLSILQSLSNFDEEGAKAEVIAEQLDIKCRAVDAAVTKSLVRYGLAAREYQVSRFLKREYALIKITPRGRDFLAYKEKNN